ncbi:F-box protein PP2-A12-like [Rhizophagus clarus]|nr:F-box protein PP2-A12-like [Rhizophagus clarus]
MSDFFSQVPSEIVVNVLSFLPAKDLCSISLVNKNLWSFIQDDYVWQSICINQFPVNYVSEELNKMIAEEYASRGSNSEEQPVNIINKKLYKRLSRHISFMAKERRITWLDIQQGGGNYHHWRTLEDSQSEFGKIVFLDNVWWFDVMSTLKAVLPGIYDIVWRLKIKSENDIHDLNFSATVVEKIEDGNEEMTIHEYNHTPQRSMFSSIARKKDWVEYRLPYNLVVPEREVIGDKLVYHDVHLKIFNYSGFLKTGLWIDYVRLREHDESRVYERFE